MPDTIAVQRRELVVDIGSIIAGGVLTMGVPTGREFGAIRRNELDDAGIFDLMARYVYDSNLDTDVADLDYIRSTAILSKWFDAVLEAALPKPEAGS